MHDPTHILNWRRLSDRITTSGQPSEHELAEIKALGVTHVINLGPHHNKGALEDEAGTLKAMDIDYIYIPVEFDAPAEADYQAFKEALTALKDTPVHVHCIYNARVSAFFYRLAKEDAQAIAVDASANMDGIWRPGDGWADIIREPSAKGQPNRFLGYEY